MNIEDERETKHLQSLAEENLQLLRFCLRVVESDEGDLPENTLMDIGVIADEIREYLEDPKAFLEKRS